jgi:glucokinase
MAELGHVSYERVCSGMGIQNLYRFLRNTGQFTEPRWLSEKLAAVDDSTPIIVETALNESSDLCKATLELFIAILGSEAGNLVLQVLATGGVYLGGGIPPKILPKLIDGHFIEAFHRKGRFADMLKRVPVDVIINPEVALFGSANYWFTMAQANSK